MKAVAVGEGEGIYSRDISDVELMGFGYQLEYWVAGARKVFRMTHFLENSCHQLPQGTKGERQAALANMSLLLDRSNLRFL